MTGQPFYLVCPACRAKRLVAFAPKRYECSSCKATLEVKGGYGTALLEWLLLTPTFLVVYWGAAQIFVSHGVNRDLAQLLGLAISGLVNVPLYWALHPMLVSVEVENTS